MSDYLITTDTGEQFLAHHGVQGMKWGKWNAETAARYAGSGSRKKYIDASPKTEVVEYRAKKAKEKENKPYATVFGESIGKFQRDHAMKNSRTQVYDIAKHLGNKEEIEDWKKTPATEYDPRDTKHKNFHEAFLDDTNRAGKAYYDRAQSIDKRIKNNQKTVAERLKREEEELGSGIPGMKWGERKSSKDAVDSKIKEAKEKPIFQEHQDARKEFQNEPKWKRNGYSSEKGHREAIERAQKMLNEKYGGKTVSTYYDQPSKNKKRYK